MIEKGADIHADNNYAIRMAVCNEHLDIVRLLIEKGADIHTDSDL